VRDFYLDLVLPGVALVAGMALVLPALVLPGLVLPALILPGLASIL
jgi:hypothetical protein